MANDYLETVLKDLYETESQRADKLDAAINLPTAIITVLLGVGGLYLEKLPTPNGTIPVIAFFVVCLGYLYFVVAAIFDLTRSYTGHKYRLVASPKTIYDYARSLLVFSNASDPSSIQHHDNSAVEGTNIRGELQAMMLEQFAEAGEQNRQRNLERTNALYSATRHIIMALILLFISRVLFHYVQDHKLRPQDVRILSFPDSVKPTN